MHSVINCVDDCHSIQLKAWLTRCTYLFYALCYKFDRNIFIVDRLGGAGDAWRAFASAGRHIVAVVVQTECYVSANEESKKTKGRDE